MSERVISREAEVAICDAADAIPDLSGQLAVRYLAHAMQSTGAERRLYLAKFAENLEQFLKSQPN